MITATITKTFNEGKMKAFVNVDIDNFIKINGCKIIEGENGYFVKMPSSKYVDSQGETHYQDIVSIGNSDFKHTFETTILYEYNTYLDLQNSDNVLKKSQETNIENQDSEMGNSKNTKEFDKLVNFSQV